MNPLTHFLASWTFAETSNLEEHDRAIVTWVGFAPDLDGLGIIPDIVARVLGYNDPTLYANYHHVLLHGLFGAFLLPAVVASIARCRLSTFFWGFMAVHIHLVCDLVGSRGQTSDDIWPVNYLEPFSKAFTLSWAGQWSLNAWPNIILTLGLIVFVFVRSATLGRSPVSLLNARAHKAFIAAVQNRWRQEGHR